ASGGMGLAVCHLLTEKGYQVFGLDIREPNVKVNWTFVQADLTDMKSVEAAKEFIQSQTDQIDAIVHLAGKYDLNSLVEMSEEDFTGIFDRNVFSVYRVNKVFLPMLKQPGKILITTSELAPLDPLPFTGIYGITKSALEKYCHSLRMELQLLDHQVVEIRPGAIKTNLLNDSQEKLEQFTENTKLYQFSGKNFKEIVDKVEARHISAEAIAQLVWKILTTAHPKFVYNINRNKLLLLYNLAPDRIQAKAIKKILLKGVKHDAK
ncbi:MAG: SDR family NAD(P)-dependent oxidoreductase, partial [Lachnospiraceae bacterium]|nr:SDR family NAD(P)-dependent oxidoreductase [Lachnospiraceae bacterium]